MGTSSEERQGTGTLYICPTPIGNLEDITIRTLNVLKKVKVIAAEDTRHTRKLTSHFGIKTPLTSYHQHNWRKKAVEIIARLRRGEDVALVCDSGTPALSDPGHELVAGAVEAGARVTALPGPSASITALVVSGFVATPFVFYGFVPRKEEKRLEFMRQLGREERTYVFYEAPHRLLKTLAALREAVPKRRLVVARELTKIHEEVLRGTVEEIYEQLRGTSPRGEFTLVLEGAEPRSAVKEADAELSLREEVKNLVEVGIPKKEAVKAVARIRGRPKQEVYQAALDIKGTEGKNRHRSGP